MKRLLPAGLIALLLVAACGDLHTDKGSGLPDADDEREDPYPPDYWDPGSNNNGNCTYGYGESCPDPAVDCDDSPCVYGDCVEGGPSGADSCLCDTGYAGLLCDGCARGYKPLDLECVKDSPCLTAPCVYGTCRERGTGFACECYAGYAGERCDRCAEGYHIEDMECVPD